MDMQSYEVLKQFKNNIDLTQRDLSTLLNYSLGRVNKSIKELKDNGFLTGNNELSEKSISLFKNRKPKNAIILSAGPGLRMLPIGNSVSKGLLKVKGEYLVERLIKQLNEVGICDITIITGFDKEGYEFLKDKYSVKLVYNKDYMTKNNAYSLSVVKELISNTFILPSDIYLNNNIFSMNELNSWYSIILDKQDNSFFSYNKKSLNIEISDSNNVEMTGVAYINSEDSSLLIDSLSNLSNIEERDSFWEESLSSLITKGKLASKIISKSEFFEINNYEHLRLIDAESENLTSKITRVLEEVFKTSINNIKNIEIMKTGMTNRSFKFSFNNINYIMRVPGFGTQKLINRKEETYVYTIVSKQGISDELIYINKDNGIKITKFIENSRVCDPFDNNDLIKAMAKLKEFHNLELEVSYRFDVFEKIDYYESLWEGKESDYYDYLTTKSNIFKLKSIIEGFDLKEVLTHIDAVPDNFLFYDNQIKMIDWEYAAMQDPHLDIAMFCIYSMYDKEHVDNLINIYFENKVDDITRGKIYAYIAMSGLLWSNWCEYKKIMGNDFGEYSLAQYNYAKDYYKYAMEILENDK